MTVAVEATDLVGKRLASQSRLTDEALLLQYRATGDRASFAELVRRYERELYSYLRRYLGNAELAEDAFQATFLLVHAKCEQFEASRRVRPWLYAIATNQAIDCQRRNRKHRMVSLDHLAMLDEQHGEKHISDLMVSREPNPMARVGKVEQDELLREALEDLPDEARAVIYLVYYQGLRYREAAEALQIPVGTVKSRLHAAVAKLSDIWNRDYAEQD